jgi:hypothetical protein
VARKAQQKGRGTTADARRSHTSAKPPAPRRTAKASSAAKAAPMRTPAAGAQPSRPGAQLQSAQIAKVEAVVGGVEAALSGLDGALSQFNQSAARLHDGLSRLTAAVHELESWIKKPAGAAEKLQGHAANIEVKLDRFKIDSQRALDLIGLKLDRVVNALGELRRTVTPPGQHSSFA